MFRIIENERNEKPKIFFSFWKNEPGAVGTPREAENLVRNSENATQRNKLATMSKRSDHVLTSKHRRYEQPFSLERETQPLPSSSSILPSVLNHPSVWTRSDESNVSFFHILSMISPSLSHVSHVSRMRPNISRRSFSYWFVQPASSCRLTELGYIR